MKTSKNRSVTTRIVIPCRFAYLNCWRPVEQYNGVQKYTISALIDKEDQETVTKVQEAIDYVKQNSLQIWGGRLPINLKTPLHDGDEERPENSAFRNCYYINAKSRDAPQIVDEQVKPITNQAEVYSGCYGKISLTLYGYNMGGSKGIAAWLGNIQKTHDGERYAHRINAADEFCVEEGG